jgi:acetyl/propionyl-CoA carboxylase alpha subunit
MKVIIENQEFIIKNLEHLKNHCSIEKIAENHWHILYHQQSISLRLINKNVEEQTAEWKINGKTVVAKYQSELEVLLQSMGLSNQNQKKIKELKSPMPGLIKKVMVKTGENIAKGEPLLILEAMKMENILKSPADLTIAQVKVHEGNAVDKNQVLIVFE